MRKNTKLSANLSRAAAARLVAACDRNYRRDANVICVGYGVKFINGMPNAETSCIQFFVKKKIKSPGEKKKLPTFVYGRKVDGSVNRSIKVLTDVIELGHAELTCRSGDLTYDGRIGGVLTLLFDNLSNRPPANGATQFGITCAHSISDFYNPSPAIDCDCCPNCVPFGYPRLICSRNGQYVHYDAALIELNRNNPHFAGKLVKYYPRLKIVGVFPRSQIVSGLSFSTFFPYSANVTGIVTSEIPMPIRMRAKGHLPSVIVQNSYAFRAPNPIKDGDSGSILFVGNLALGIQFSRSGKDHNIGFFHSIDEVLADFSFRTGGTVQAF